MTLKALLQCAVSVLILTSVLGAAQRRPDLSGDWVLVRATTAAATASSASVEIPTAANTFSGAAFNCGRQCTIVHKGMTLTIIRALLSEESTPASTVALQISGRPLSIVDSFSPERKLSATAKWSDARLEITSVSGPLTVSQSITIEAEELVVVTSMRQPSRQPVTFRYKRAG